MVVIEFESSWACLRFEGTVRDAGEWIPHTSSEQATSRGRLAAIALYTRRPNHATPGKYPSSAIGQKIGSREPTARIALNPCVILSELDTACIDRMHSSRLSDG
jgi:hypothetical protein